VLRVEFSSKETVFGPSIKPILFLILNINKIRLNQAVIKKTVTNFVWIWLSDISTVVIIVGGRRRQRTKFQN